MICGLIFTLFGLTIGVTIWLLNDRHLFFILQATFSAFISGYLFSKLIFNKYQKFLSLRIVITILLLGLISHWICWLFLIIEKHVKPLFFNINIITPESFFEEISLIPAISIISWIFLGWFTLIGAYLSVQLTRFIKREVE